MKVGKRGSKRLLLAEQHEAQARASAVELGERQQAERHRAARRRPARVEGDRVRPPLCEPRAVNVVVDAELEVLGDGAEALAQQLREPGSGGDVMQALRVAALGPM